MKKISKELELQIIDLYKKGWSMKNIGKLYGISSVTVMNILNRHGVNKRTKGGIYLLPEETIIERYKNGESCETISQSFNVSFHTISNILEKNKIIRNNRYRNVNLIQNYFDRIDTYDKAYFLGYLITDGNVGKKSNSVSLGISSKDIHILGIFKEKTQNENKIYHRKDKDGVSISVKSSCWKKDLEKYGVVPCKTSNEYIPIVCDELLGHLIRGLIDGDGWISSKAHQLGFCGSKTCVTQLRDILVEKLGVYNVKVLQTQPHLWQVCWAGKKDICNICNFMYKDKKDCFLERKYNEFILIQDNTEVNR